MHVGKQEKTKEFFDCLHGEIEGILKSDFSMSYSNLDNETRIYYNSNQISSNFKMVIFEENVFNYVPNTLIKLDRCTLKINYFEVFPVGEGLGTKLLQELIILLKKVPIKRIVVIPENKGVVFFWKKNNFKAFKDCDTQLYLDI